MTQVQEAKLLISQLIDKVKTLNAEKESLLQEIDSLKKSSVVVMDTSELENVNATLTNELLELKEHYAFLQDEHERAETAIAKFAGLRKDDRDIISDLKKQISEKNLELSRKEDILKSAVSVRRELEGKNRELLEKLARLSSGNAIQQSDINATAKPYRFGKTTLVIIDKAKMFIDGLFSGAKKITYNGVDETLLNSPESVRALLGLSEKETAVFMERLENIKHNNVPLCLVDENGNLATMFDCDWMKDYISEIIS